MRSNVSGRELLATGSKGRPRGRLVGETSVAEMSTSGISIGLSKGTLIAETSTRGTLMGETSSKGTLPQRMDRVVVEVVDQLLARRPGLRGCGASPYGPSCW